MDKVRAREQENEFAPFGTLVPTALFSVTGEGFRLSSFQATLPFAEPNTQKPAAAEGLLNGFFCKKVKNDVSLDYFICFQSFLICWLDFL